jgi:dihydrodipicolinate reductase
MLKAKGAYFEDYEISITESHQSTKKTEPGTAFAFADSLNFPHNRIVSVRDPQVQKTQFHIPNAYLDRHAFHRLVFKDGDDEVTIETKVLGHHSYVQGVRRIIDTVLRYNLENKRHTVLELIEKAML